MTPTIPPAIADESPLFDEVLSIPQAARLFRMTRSRMSRFLMSRHRALNGGLLVDMGRGALRPRWTVTLRALKAVAPQWFLDPESLQRQIDWLKSEVDEVRGQVIHFDRRLREHDQRLDLQRDALVTLRKRAAAG